MFEHLAKNARKGNRSVYIRFVSGKKISNHLLNFFINNQYKKSEESLFFCHY